MNSTTNNTPCLDILKTAWPPFTANLKLTLGVPALMLTVPFLLVVVPAGIAAFVLVGAEALMHKNPGPGMIPILLISVPLFVILYNGIRVGWTKITLDLAAGRSSSFSQLTQSKQWLVNFIITLFIIGIATAIGGFLLVIPGVYVAVRTAFAPFLVVDQNLGPIEAIVKSNELVTGYAWQILLYLVLFAVANFVVGFVPIIGAVLPVALIGFFDLALAMIYRMRVGQTVDTSTAAV